MEKGFNGFWGLIKFREKELNKLPKISFFKFDFGFPSKVVKFLTSQFTPRPRWLMRMRDFGINWDTCGRYGYQMFIESTTFTS
jgi:hypothetical protein